MIKASNTFLVSINAKPEIVFDYVSDLRRHSEWNEGLRIEALTPGPPGVGSRYHTVGNVLKKDRPNELEVTLFQPPTRFAFVVQDPNFNKIMHEFSIQAKDNITLLERTVEANMPLLVWIVWRLLIFPFIDRPSMNKSLAALKAVSER